MIRPLVRQLLFAAISLITVVLLSSCGTTPSRHATRQLPPFEPPIAKADFQTVRTTAYTHTESDHLEYGRRNALGGELHAATVPRRRAEYISRTLPRIAAADVEYQFGAASKKSSASDDEEKPKAKSAKSKSAKTTKHGDDEAAKAKPTKSAKSAKAHKSDHEDSDIPKAKPVKATAKNAKAADDDDADVPKAKPAKVARRGKAADEDEKPAKSAGKSHVAKNEKAKLPEGKSAKGAKRATAVKKAKPPVIGSAAADWARWPYGTTFRILSTGQVYRVDDIGWALAGRNTIDLYMPSRRDMNAWGTRNEKIQVIKWGDQEESARLLAARSDYKHVRRMLLELSGRYDEAAQLQ